MTRKGQHLSRGTNRWKTNHHSKQLKDYERRERKRIREEARRQRSVSNSTRTSRSRSYSSKPKYSYNTKDDDIFGTILLCIMFPPIGIIWVGLKIIDFIRSVLK